MGEFAVFGAAVGAMISTGATPGRSWSFGIPPSSAWSAWGLLLAAGAAWGVLWAWRRGADPIQAARSLDRRYDLQDLLATAAETLKRGDRSPMALCCCRQAETAAAGLRHVTFPPERRSMMLVSGGMVLASAAVIALVARPPVNPDVRYVLNQTDGMSAAGRARLAESIRDAATGDEPIDPAALARAIEVRDEKELARLVAELEARGLTLRQVLPPAAARQLGLPPQPPEPTANGQTPTVAQLPETQPSSAGRQTVTASAGGDPTVSETSSTATASPLSADSWSAAKARAASVSRRESVPAAYRGIVEAFVGEGPEGLRP